MTLSAAAASSPTLTALVTRLGAGATARQLGISTSTLYVRLRQPLTCTVQELHQLATAAGVTSWPALAELLAAEAGADAVSAGAGVEGLPFAFLSELLHARAGRYELAAIIDVTPKTLAGRLRNPGRFTLAELLAIAQWSGQPLAVICALGARELAERPAPPTAVRGRRYDSK